MYEIGKIYIWQNQVGLLAHLNDSECTVLEAPTEGFDILSRSRKKGQLTDSTVPDSTHCYYAEVGDLRLKAPPSGESTILKLFKIPECEFD